MMQNGNIPAINSNIQNFLSPNIPPQSHLHRINPDKHTFLNSNLLVSNILNHLPNSAQPQNKTSQNAYDNKDEETVNHLQRKSEEREKIDRVSRLAKCRSQATLEEMMAKERKISQQVNLKKRQVDEIHLMRKEMTDKARDILSRKDDSTYLGRNIVQEGQKFLKGMKETNPENRAKKSEATRTLMKESGKKVGRKERINQRRAEGNDSFFSDNQMSVLDVSMSGSMLRREEEERDAQKIRDEKVGRLVRNNSYDQVFQQERRLASWQGFSECWKRAFLKNDDIIVTKPGKRLKKQSRPRYVEPSHQSILQYNDKLSRHAALKTYGKAFAQTACSVNIEVK